MTTEAKPLRRDAARNRDKLRAAASEVFTAKGLDASLEEIAKHAKVSIGTLYNHFPTREALFDAIFPERVEATEALAREALTSDDAWDGFAGYLEGLFDMLAADRGLRHVMTREYPAAEALTEACHRGFAATEAIVLRAKESGSLRADFEMSDLASVLWAMAHIIDTTADVAPGAWRRFLAFILDGLRSEAAHPIAVEAMRPEQIVEALLGPGD